VTAIDPIRDWVQRHRSAQARVIENAMTGTAGTEQVPPAVESLTAGAEPQAPPPPSMDDYMRDRDNWGGHAA
jgi:hypothetical protein